MAVRTDCARVCIQASASSRGDSVASRFSRLKMIRRSSLFRSLTECGNSA